MCKRLGVLFLLICITFSLCDDLPTYFGIDLDGTFHIGEPRKFQRNVEALIDLQAMGIKPFFCTGKMRVINVFLGRNLHSAMKLVGESFVAQTGYKGFPGVYSNGAAVYDENGYLISVTQFHREFLRVVMGWVIFTDLEEVTVFHTVEHEYTLSKLKEDFERRLDKNVDRQIASPGKIFVSNIVGITINQPVTIPELQGKFVSKKTRNGIYHISPYDVTKAYGTRKLLARLNSKFGDCGFVGDGDNDREMMEACAYSFAVGNASDDVKHSAKLVMTKTYDENSFVDVVETLFQLQNIS